MIIYLIRHGEKEQDWCNEQRLNITERGRRQADKTGLYLKNKNIEKIYASSMTRAIQTAELINRHLLVDIEIHDDLCEINMGDCNNFGWDYVAKHNKQFCSDFQKHEWDIPYPNGESGTDVWNRVSPVITYISNSKNKCVAIVTHGGVIRALISGLLGIPQNNRFFLGEPLENCSITTIKFNENTKRYTLHDFNYNSHIIDI